MKRTLCIWLPNWPLQRTAAAQPELKDRPLVLYETYRGGRRVTACSAQAATMGITVGMPLAEAMAIHPSSFPPHPSSLAPHPSPLVPHPSDPQADHDALEDLAAWCRQFSPIIGIADSAGYMARAAKPSTQHSVPSTQAESEVGSRKSEVGKHSSFIPHPSPLAPHPSPLILHPSPDSLLLDITGLEHLFGGEGPLAGKIIEQFAVQRGLAVRVAIADTVGAAWAMAHYGEVQNANCKLQIANCKLQNVGQAPPLNNSSFIIHHSSSLLVPPGQTLAALRGLPIEALRLSREVVELLHPLGIHRIGQLEAIPRAELAARLGASIARRWDQAIGQAAEPIPASPLPAELQVRESLEYPTTRREAVQWTLEQLIGQVAAKLLDCGRGAMRLQCRLECQSSPAVELSVGLFEPTASPEHLFQLVCLQLERLSIPAPVVGIAVEVTTTAPLVCRQESLFADGPGQHRPRLLAGLVDRLANRLGRNAVLRPRLVPDAQPESACQYEPLIGGAFRERAGVREKRRLQNANCKLQNANWVTSPRSSFIIHHSSFPLRLFRSPLPLAAMSLMPEGPPLRFAFRGQEHRIARAWGPERIETGWWRGRPIARDYYRLETSTGHRFWLFRRLDDGRWFLHGTFE